LAEAKIRWAFWPPSTDPNKVEPEVGIWVSGDFEDLDESDVESEGEEDEDGKRKEDKPPKGLEDDPSEDEEEGEEEIQPGGRFGALALEQEGPGTEDSDEEEEDSE
jgi:hypothetical protein